MKRRETTIALAVLAVVPFSGEAQPTGKSYRIGFLGLTSPSDYAPFLNAFLQGLRELGYEPGEMSSSSTGGRMDAMSAFPNSPSNWRGSTPTCWSRTRPVLARSSMPLRQSPS